MAVPGAGARAGRRAGRGPDVAVVGSGPNGLAAAVTMARAGLRVELYEAAPQVGGGLRSAPIFRDDVLHDICASVHPMALASPFLRQFDLPAHGVELLVPEVGYAHPLDGTRAAVAYRSLERTCAGLGADGPRWRALMEPLVRHSGAVVDLMLLGRSRLPAGAAAPALLGRRVLAHGTRAAGHRFAGPEAAALLAGVAAHVVGPLPSLTGAAVAMMLGHLAHTEGGWPLVRGGSGRLADALAAELVRLGGRIVTGTRIDDLREVADARVVLLDLAPKEFLRLAGPLLPAGYRRSLRSYRYGPGAAKVDYLVSEPVPWAAPEARRAGTVHLGGSEQEIFRAERLVADGVRPPDPFVLVVDPAVTDPGRAAGRLRPVWAYAHVPHGDPADPVELVTRRIERWAPGFRDTVVASRGLSAAQLELYNPNYVGGDIAAGALTLRQSVLRPAPRWNPYRTPLPGTYLCSASTPPGPGVHGMCGFLAARSALAREFGIRIPADAAWI
ncbi:NAD(P)/FAD-dependent oxidoreductase [Kitasatospora sp. NPDC094015]|uniref:phytoene desaturase family protein n=1 Tax=Kitasatospora sp. NPDC094015 TaxID=3155205 RepID=UPI00332F4404